MFLRNFLKMKLTKDEARILADALRIAKFEYTTLSFNIFDKLSELEKRLDDFGKDKRRTGRTSQNDFNDCLKRCANKPNYNENN